MMSNYSLRSYNEWGKLHEVIVGNPFTASLITNDYSFRHFNFDNLGKEFEACHLELVPNRHEKGVYSTNQLGFKQQYLLELEEDIDELVGVLRSFGVSVLRPKEIESSVTVTTPYWAAMVWPALNIRDRALILGENIIETTPCIRSRYFETDLLKELFYQFFERGANWLSMPKPILTDMSFDLTYINSLPYKAASRELIANCCENHYDVGLEMLIDAANCLRLGKDVIVNVADKNQYLAFKWLSRSMGGEFDFHLLDSITDNHIDSYIVVLRPGLLMLRNKSVLGKLPGFMRNWDCIIAPEATDHVFPSYSSDDVIITSKYIDTNIISLDENTVIANSLNTDLIRLLEQNKIEVIPVQHRHRRLFGGGFHCFTLDTNRDSELISYR